MTALPGLHVARDAGGNGTTPKAARLALGALLAKDGPGPLDVKKGVIADGGGPVVTGTAGMAYSVRAFGGAVGLASAVNGPTITPNDAAVSVATDPAPGSNSRIDVIYIWQKLVTGDGGSESTNAPVIAVAKGATNAFPTAPSIPTGAVELGRATVTAGATATSALSITQGATTHTGNDTGWLPCPSYAPGFIGTLYARQAGPLVMVRGTLDHVTALEIPAYTYLFTLPDGVGRPIDGWVTNGQRGQECQNFRVDVGGGVLTVTNPATACRWWVADTIRFFAN